MVVGASQIPSDAISSRFRLHRTPSAQAVAGFFAFGSRVYRRPYHHFLALVLTAVVLALANAFALVVFLITANSSNDAANHEPPTFSGDHLNCSLAFVEVIFRFLLVAVANRELEKRSSCTDLSPFALLLGSVNQVFSHDELLECD